MIYCKLCESDNVTELYSFKEYRMLKCEKCDLIFTDHDNLPKNLYSEEYYTKVHPNYFSDNKKNKKKIKNFIHGIWMIHKYKDKGLLLDVGCATGIFLDIARKNGWSVTGVDISDYATKQVKSNFGIKAIHGNLNDAKFSDKSFDVITMWDFLEHVQDPNIVLSETRRILKNDGILFIHTINEDSLMSKLAHWIYTLSLKQIKFPAKLIHPIHHNFHYSEKTLKEFLKKYKFKVIYQEKSEMPAENIEQSTLIRLAAKMLYIFSEILNQQHEIKLIAKKET